MARPPITFRNINTPNVSDVAALLAGATRGFDVGGRRASSFVDSLAAERVQEDKRRTSAAIANRLAGGPASNDSRVDAAAVNKIFNANALSQSTLKNDRSDRAKSALEQLGIGYDNSTKKFDLKNASELFALGRGKTNAEIAAAKAREQASIQTGNAANFRGKETLFDLTQKKQDLKKQEILDDKLSQYAALTSSDALNEEGNTLFNSLVESGQISKEDVTPEYKKSFLDDYNTQKEDGNRYGDIAAKLGISSSDAIGNLPKVKMEYDAQQSVQELLTKKATDNFEQEKTKKANAQKFITGKDNSIVKYENGEFVIGEPGNSIDSKEARSIANSFRIGDSDTDKENLNTLLSSFSDPAAFRYMLGQVTDEDGNFLADTNNIISTQLNNVKGEAASFIRGYSTNTGTPLQNLLNKIEADKSGGNVTGFDKIKKNLVAPGSKESADRRQFFNKLNTLSNQINDQTTAKDLLQYLSK